MAVAHDDLCLPQQWLRLTAQLESVVCADAVTALLSATTEALRKLLKHLQGAAPAGAQELGSNNVAADMSLLMISGLSNPHPF